MNRALAVFALLVLAGFLAILLFSVPRIDLGVVIAVCFLMVVYDFFKPRLKD